MGVVARGNLFFRVQIEGAPKSERGIYIRFSPRPAWPPGALSRRVTGAYVKQKPCQPVRNTAPRGKWALFRPLGVWFSERCSYFRHVFTRTVGRKKVPVANLSHAGPDGDVAGPCRDSVLVAQLYERASEPGARGCRGSAAVAGRAGKHWLGGEPLSPARRLPTRGEAGESGSTPPGVLLAIVGSPRLSKTMSKASPRSPDPPRRHRHLDQPVRPSADIGRPIDNSPQRDRRS